ncbi:hypothetical protein BJV82DRAFT_605443 [Fennellomyces sp. T-0311]|nr:hypothetical protein BJV82DRAFT_605443 [Fennellomyces sp. T-0311]
MKRSHHPAAPVSEPLLQNDSSLQRKRHKRGDEFLVFGYEARIFNDKATAIKVNKGQYLIPWQSNDNCYMMDRYDVRHLLPDLPRASQTHSVPKDKELDQERYADLDSEEEALFDMSEDEREAHVEEKRRQRQKKEEKSFQAYNYEGQRMAVQKELAAQYKAPADMAVPASPEQASIIADTAKAARASANPNLFEIKMQARQANNPLYAFLSKRDTLYPFYKHLSWLLSSGLGAYGDSDSDSEEEDKPDKPTDDEVTNAIEKTAQFVARSGPDLEQKIRGRHAHDPKFAFLNQHHKYHAYYQSRVKHFQT